MGTHKANRESTSPLLLLVEDEPMLARALGDVLNASGYDVCMCDSASVAFDHIHMERDISAIVTDIQLGEGADGWEVARQARERFPDANILYMTGRRALDFDSKGVAGGVLLQKPFAESRLLAALAGLLNRNPAADLTA
jgi:DNA-binding response OmpR family regulator